MRMNFTNEGGAGGTTRLLKNICGLCLCSSSAGRRGTSRWQWGLGRLTDEVGRCQTARCVYIDPDAADFLASKDMPEAIRQFTRRTGQAAPEDEGALSSAALWTARDEIPPRASDVRAAQRRPDPHDPYRRGRDPEPAALPGNRRCACGRRVADPPKPPRSNLMMQAVAAGDVSGIAEWQPACSGSPRRGVRGRARPRLGRRREVFKDRRHGQGRGKLTMET